jgi:hypothetical protein
MPEVNATGERQPMGRIVVLEDTNNDGRMDKRTVFQDGFVLARWVKVLERGVLVAEPPNLWLFQDTNGDLRADRRELVTNLYGRREANVEDNANSPRQWFIAGTGCRPSSMAMEPTQKTRGSSLAVSRPPTRKRT